ncbi:MAG: hypothetical protein U0T82_00695 [Bacteroidales bacterium]
MTPILQYHRRFFSRTIRIFSGESQVGFLAESAWKRKAEGELYGKKYLFETRGIFKPETSITGMDAGMISGKITYGKWKSKAIIEYNGEDFEMKYTNFWHTRWAITGRRGTRLRCQGHSLKGRIEVMNADEGLVLTGLYIASYFTKQASAAAAAAT